MKTRVIKIGGSVLDGHEDVVRTAGIVDEYADRGKVIAVVSAVRGMTDEIQRHLSRGVSRSSMDSLLAAIHERFRQFTRWTPNRVEAVLEPLMSRLRKLLEAIAALGETPDFLADAVLCMGERLTSLVLVECWRDQGLDVQERLPESMGLITDGVLGHARVDVNACRESVRQAVSGLRCVVVPGFYGISRRGQINLFGRGGSDYSAAVIAACVPAQSLDLWKGVDGFMTADPSTVANAHPLKRLSFAEAAELSACGVAILHPRTLEPLRNCSIPVRVFRYPAEPKAMQPRTVIRSHLASSSRGIKGIACSARRAMVHVYGATQAWACGGAAAISEWLTHNGIHHEIACTSGSSMHLMVDSEDLELTCQAMRRAPFAGLDHLSHAEDVCRVALVGQGPPSNHAFKAWTALEGQRIHPLAVFSDHPDLSTSFIVRGRDHQRAVQCLHQEFFS